MQAVCARDRRAARRGRSGATRGSPTRSRTTPSGSSSSGASIRPSASSTRRAPALERCRDLGGLGGRVDRPLGSVYLALKEPAKAREALARHLARQPDDGWAHLELGKALADASDDGGARRVPARAHARPRARRGAPAGRASRSAARATRPRASTISRSRRGSAASSSRRSATSSAPTTCSRRDSPRQPEVEQAIEELRPLVRERQRERLERQRTGRRGFQP